MNPDSASQLVLLRAGIFVVLLVALFALQTWRPRRAVPGGWRRWAGNLGLIVTATLLLRLLVPLGAVAFAAAWPWGLFHHVALPPLLAAAIGLLLLDLGIYWQHRAFHRWPLLWRAHRVHHTDTAFDVSLGVRFHPLEILPSYGWKLLVVAVVGIAPLTFAAYEIGLLAFSLWSHTNLALPERIDVLLRRVIITPDWHRIHHSVHGDELNSNFGNLLSVWDRLFGTAREAPRDGQQSMRLGLEQFRDAHAQRFFALLLQPLHAAPPEDAGEA
jgi:sterol desaturase/sphingolipid hydroxylase (fatty acid hydroxylase superfamily)